MRLLRFHRRSRVTRPAPTSRRFPLKGHELALGAVLFVALWALSALGPLRTFVPHWFALAGWPGTERNYLILLQNDAELRPTGGFISAFALLEFKHGIPVGFSLEDVYGPVNDAPYESPPFPLDVLLEEGSTTYPGHGFRDSNVHPDYPTSVESILTYYHNAYPDREIHGVVAVNFAVLEDIVGLYEPIEVERYEITERTLFETLEAAVSDIDYHNEEAIASRKDILKTFAKELMVSLVVRFDQWRALSEVIGENLNEKQILVYLANERLEDKMKALNWAGAYPASPAENGHDLLSVNLSNYGGMKSNRYLTQTVDYHVELTDQRDDNGQPIAYSTLTVRLDHRGDTNTPLSGGYKGYLRAILPEGSTLLDSSTGDSTEQAWSQGYTEWGDFVELYPGESITYTYRFQLSPYVFQDDHYELTLYKQPGTHGDLYNVSIKSPKGHALASEDLSLDLRENLLLFRDQLNQDHTLVVDVLPDTAAPRLYGHTVTGLNVIELEFAEDMSPESIEDLLNYEVVDADTVDPDTTDTLRVTLATVEGGTVTLYTEGMTLQPEERYLITFRNLRDSSGNLVQPNPRTVTVVQRLEE